MNRDSDPNNNNNDSDNDNNDNAVKKEVDENNNNTTTWIQEIAMENLQGIWTPFPNYAIYCIMNQDVSCIFISNEDIPEIIAKSKAEPEPLPEKLKHINHQFNLQLLIDTYGLPLDQNSNNGWTVSIQKDRDEIAKAVHNQVEANTNLLELIELTGFSVDNLEEDYLAFSSTQAPKQEDLERLLQALLRLNYITLQLAKTILFENAMKLGNKKDYKSISTAPENETNEDDDIYTAPSDESNPYSP